MHLDSSDIMAMPSRQRAALVNSLSGYKSANLVGTADADGRSNLAIMSSVVHLGSHPPLMALIVRPGGDDRHTLSNLLATGHYSINHVSEDMVQQAHQTAARYSRETCEFSATGLTPKWWPDFRAPLVAEAPIRLALELREHRELDINGTHLVIGEIVKADLPEQCLRDDGSLDLRECGTVALAGLDSYYRTSLSQRMAYAKPDLPPRALPASQRRAGSDTESAIRNILDSQVQCVLSTFSGTQPSQHLMAYAFNPALSTVYLASQAGTEKARNMLHNPEVSLLWDNRTGNTRDHVDGVALTATGRATALHGWQRLRIEHLLIARNPQIKVLLAREDTLVFAVDIKRFRLSESYDTVATYTPQGTRRPHITPVATANTSFTYRAYGRRRHSR